MKKIAAHIDGAVWLLAILAVLFSLMVFAKSKTQEAECTWTLCHYCSEPICPCERKRIEKLNTQEMKDLVKMKYEQYPESHLILDCKPVYRGKKK